jgi:6-phosphofructokinase 1
MNCLVAQSGGPTAVINGSVFGILDGAIKIDKIKKVYGGKNGIEGILNEQLIELSNWDKKKCLTFLYSPSSGLGSCRYKLPEIEENEAVYNKIFKIFDKYHIGYFFYIGGNDSMDTIYKLSCFGDQINSTIRFIGIPKTIDNDLYGTDHCPGYGSAAKYVIRSLMEMVHDANVYQQASVHIVEVMGRHTGWVGASSAIARYGDKQAVDLLYLPERPFSENQFFYDVKEKLINKKHVIVVVSEGLKKSDGKFLVSNENNSNDYFGYKKMGGVASYLASKLRAHVTCKIVPVEMGILQRCSIYHGSQTDLNEAINCGYQGLIFALQGVSGQMVIMEREKGASYQVHYRHTPIQQVANKEKPIPHDWINTKGNHMNQSFHDYIHPLIQGNIQVQEKDGIPIFIGDKI